MSEHVEKPRRSAGRPAGPVRQEEPGRSYAIGLRSWVATADKSHTRLAEETGYAPTTLSHTLSGARFPGMTERLLQRALTILEACGATPADLAAWERFHADLAAWARRGCSGAPPQPPRPPGAEPTAQKAELPDAVKRLLMKQLDDGESVPYRLPAGRLPHLSEVYVRQLLGPDETDEVSDTTARPAHDVVLRAPEHLLVIAGPGGGKSTLVRRLAGTFAVAWLEQDIAPPLVPTWVTAAELARRPDTIESTLIPQTLPPGIRWLALVDGVDEIVDTSRRRDFVLRIARIAERHRSDLQLLITSRPLPRDEDDALRSAGISPYVLEPFDRLRFINFAQRWFGDSEKAEEYVRQVDRACLGPLVRVPLLATITAVVYEAYPNSSLPANQYLLYEQYRRHLAKIKDPQLREQWQRLEEAVRLQIPRAADGVSGLAAECGVELLYHLAVEQTSRAIDSLTTVALQWLDDHLDIQASHLILDWPEYIRGLLAATGMLLRAGPDVRFLHTSFAEHLAAEYRAQQLPETLDFSEPSWATVIHQARAHDETALATLVHAAHHSTTRTKKLLEKLENGSNADRLVAAHILAEGPILDDTHAQWFLAQLELADPDLDLDWWALASRIVHPGVAEQLAELARQPTERRFAAASALAAHRPDVAGLELANIVQSDSESWENRCDALRTLIRLGGEQARQAALSLRDALLEQDRDRLDIENAIGALEEIWPVGELELYLRERSTLSDGSAQFVALSALTYLSDELNDEISRHLVSLIEPSDIESAISRNAIAALAQTPGGKSKMSELLISQSLNLKDQLDLVGRGMQSGVLEQETAVNMLAATAELPRWYEFADNLEVYEGAVRLRRLLDDLHEDMRPTLCSTLQRNTLLRRNGRFSRQAIVMTLMVAGWEMLREYEWIGYPRSNYLVMKVLNEASLYPVREEEEISYTERPWGAWLRAAESFAGRNDSVSVYAPTEVPNCWGEWIGWLALMLGENGSPSWGDLDDLVHLTADRDIPTEGQLAILLMVVLLLCVPNARTPKGMRALYIGLLGEICGRKMFSRRLRKIASWTEFDSRY